MIPRFLTRKLYELSTAFPVVTLTGPRQSGKSTLIREAFSDYRYVSLEDPDMRAAAHDDPRSFLQHFNTHVIFDEIQRVPTLFSPIQGIVDNMNEPGQYILSGSQNFLLMNNISQSLAGRAAILHLLPFSYAELSKAHQSPSHVDTFLFQGGYPRIYASRINPMDFFSQYLSTYVERDVRSELGVRKIHQFRLFVNMLATRAGQVLNITGLANDCDISVETVNDWLSVLEASFIIFRLQPYYKNYGKRLIKAPKLYFYDTGLLAHLLDIESDEMLLAHQYRGALFENAVIVEIVKHYYAQGRKPHLFYWRDSNGNEIDLIIEKAGKPRYAIEMKSSATYRPEAFKVLDLLQSHIGLDAQQCFVIANVEESFATRHGQVLSFVDISQLAL